MIGRSHLHKNDIFDHANGLEVTAQYDGTLDDGKFELVGGAICCIGNNRGPV